MKLTDTPQTPETSTETNKDLPETEENTDLKKYIEIHEQVEGASRENLHLLARVKQLEAIQSTMRMGLQEQSQRDDLQKRFVIQNMVEWRAKACQLAESIEAVRAQLWPDLRRQSASVQVLPT